jgi:hypothetical protein
MTAVGYGTEATGFDDGDIFLLLVAPPPRQTRVADAR